MKALYDDMFGRAPDAAGLAYWTAWATFRGPGGLASWTAEITSGRLRQEDLRGQLIASDEYYNRAGGTAQGYVTQLYRDVLGRAAASSEVAYWAGAITASGRAAASSGLWYSLEGAQRRVNETYDVYLDRAAEPGGLNSWAPYWIVHGEDALRVGIVSSAEYLDRARRLYP